MYKFIFFFILVLLAACTNNKGEKQVENTSPLNEVTQPVSPSLIFDQLVGSWQSEDGKSFERWMKNTDGTFRTSVYSLKGNDTVWAEEGKVYSENANWVFENLVKGQNDGKAVRFTSTSLGENSVHFSNPAHDFPTDIHYDLPDANTIHAYIVGPNKEGGKDTIPFNYKKVN